jgi:hypothetical protein
MIVRAFAKILLSNFSQSRMLHSPMVNSNHEPHLGNSCCATSKIDIAKNVDTIDRGDRLT